MNPLPKLIQKAFRPAQKEENQCQSPEGISLSQQIANYTPLLDLQDKRQLLQVEVVGSCHQQTYQSMILGLDFANKYLFLDSLTPVNPYCPIVIGDSLRLTHQRYGQVLSVFGRLIDIRDEKGQLYYVMALPEELSYTQRRLLPRIHHNALHENACPFSLKVKSPLKTPWHALTKNISAGGICFSIPGRVSNQLKINTVLHGASVSIGELNFTVNLKVKSFKDRRRPFEQTEIHAQFIDLNVQTKIRLQNIIGFYADANEGEAVYN